MRARKRLTLPRAVLEEILKLIPDSDPGRMEKARALYKRIRDDLHKHNKQLVAEIEQPQVEQVETS